MTDWGKFATSAPMLDWLRNCLNDFLGKVLLQIPLDASLSLMDMGRTSNEYRIRAMLRCSKLEPQYIAGDIEISHQSLVRLPVERKVDIIRLELEQLARSMAAAYVKHTCSCTYDELYDSIMQRRIQAEEARDQMERGGYRPTPYVPQVYVEQVFGKFPQPRPLQVIMQKRRRMADWSF